MNMIRRSLLVLLYCFVLPSIACFAESPTNKAKSTIAEFLATLEASRAKQVTTLKSTSPSPAAASEMKSETSLEDGPAPDAGSLDPALLTTETNTRSTEPAAPAPSDWDDERGRVWDSSNRVNHRDRQREKTRSYESSNTVPDAAPMITPVNTMSLRGVFTTSQLPVSHYRPALDSPSHRDPFLGSPSTLAKHWTADNLAHKTLYFEDLRLERHGQSHGDFVQFHASSFRFLTDAVLIPFRLALSPPNRCFYVQCEGRPGTRRD